LRQVNEVFQDELPENEPKYNRVQVKETLLLRDGEVPKEWLCNFSDFKTWQDFGYTCFHCKKQIKSLRLLLEHFDHKLSILKRTIKCSFCGKVFGDSPTYLISYLNHMDKEHFTHLKFTCVQCGKVYVNVVKLYGHVVAEHPECTLKIFPCFDCGLVCPTVQKLKLHKNSHTI
jgi:hypothetical protein